MKTIKRTVTVELNVPVGYRVIGYRCPDEGDLIMIRTLVLDEAEVLTASHSYHCNRRFILEKEEPN